MACTVFENATVCEASHPVSVPIEGNEIKEICA